jgi:hypothetical protein
MNEDQHYIITNPANCTPEAPMRLAEAAELAGLPVLFSSHPQVKAPPIQGQTLRDLVREEVGQALHPGMPDPRVYIRAQVEQDGHIYSGLLYLRVPEGIDE